MKIKAPDWIWGDMCNLLAVGVIMGFRFRSNLWVAFIRITYGSITWGSFVIGYFLLQGVLTLMYFCVAPFLQ